MMHRRVFSSGLATALAAASAARASEGGDRAGLEEAVRHFGETWARGDVGAAEALLSPTYTHIDVTGAVQDCAAWLAYAAGRAGLSTRIRFAEVRTRVLGDVAIVTGRNDVEGLSDALVPGQEDASIRFTQVWVRRGERRWLREAFQATRVSIA
jgi:ketosteroid isomerase-like protein